MSLELQLYDLTIAVLELTKQLQSAPILTQALSAQPNFTQQINNELPPSPEILGNTASQTDDLPELKPWAEKTIADYERLKEKEATLDTVREALLVVNAKIGRPQASAILARFGAVAITSKGDKKGLTESQYRDCLDLTLSVLSGRVDLEAFNG